MRRLVCYIFFCCVMLYAYSAKTEHSLRMSGALFRYERIIALLVNKVTCFLHVYRGLESLIDML